MAQNKRFDLSQISWKAFSREEMFSRRWYLRRERLIFYTLTMLIGMAAQGAATYCMFKYRFLRTHIQDFTAHAAHVHNVDIEATTILSITFPCISVLLFNAEYFVILFWPGQTYGRTYMRAKRGVFVAATAAALATIIASTIIVATRSASITGVDEATVQQLTALYFRPPLQYNTWPQNIVWVVLLWITVVLNIISTILLLKATQREERTMTTTPADDSIPSASADVIVVEKDSDSEIKEKSIVSARTDEVSV